MGSTGIEHRSADSVLQAYNNYDMPNFSVWQGKRLCLKYEGGNLEEGQGELNNHLQTIANSGTTGIYSLRVYKGDIENIDSKTPYGGSTTFQLTSFVPGGATNPVVNVQMPNQPQQLQNKVSGTDNAYNPRVSNEINELRKENKLLRDKLHNKEIESIREDFKQQIAGLREDLNKKTVWDHIGSLFDKHGDKITETVKTIVTSFAPAKNNYIQNNEPGQVAGTRDRDQNTDTDMILKYSKEGALINPFLSEDELKLKRSEQAKIIKPIIEQMDEEGQTDIQNECLGVIEKRISNATLTRLLLVVACLDNDDLNKLLNNLD